MIAYVDASIVMRIVLGQSNRLAEWESIGKVVTSVRKLVGLGMRRTHSLVTIPKVPSWPQIKPGKSNGYDS